MPLQHFGCFKPHHNYQRKFKSPKFQIKKKSNYFVPVIDKMYDGGYVTETWTRFTILFLDEFTKQITKVNCTSNQRIRDVCPKFDSFFYIFSNGKKFKIDTNITIRTLQILPRMRDIKKFVIYSSSNLLLNIPNQLTIVRFTRINKICCICQEEIVCQWIQCVGCTLFGSNINLTIRLQKANETYVCIIYKLDKDTNLIKCMAPYDYKNYTSVSLYKACKCYKIDFIEQNGLLYSLESGRTMPCLTLSDGMYQPKIIPSLKEIQTFSKTQLKIIPLKPQKEMNMCIIL